MHFFSTARFSTLWTEARFKMNEIKIEDIIYSFCGKVLFIDYA